MKTKFKSKENALADKKWHIIDAKGKVVGRLASEIASLIRGKHKPDFTPHVDGGDFVIVINAKDIRFTGNKLNTKLYRHHTGYVGGLVEIPAATVLEKHPVRIMEKAVWGMLPKNKLGSVMRKRLKVYSGSEHSHSAQMPEKYELKYC